MDNTATAAIPLRWFRISTLALSSENTPREYIQTMPVSTKLSRAKLSRAATIFGAPPAQRVSGSDGNSRPGLRSSQNVISR